jgi:hypothetical protein
MQNGKPEPFPAIGRISPLPLVRKADREGKPMGVRVTRVGESKCLSVMDRIEYVIILIPQGSLLPTGVLSTKHDYMETKTDKQNKRSNQRLQRASVATVLCWNNIYWDKIEKSVVTMQHRIVEAIKKKRFNKSKALRWMLVHSFKAKLLAIKRVTHTNGNLDNRVENKFEAFQDA